ncbi:mucin-5AC-like isoform X1 [Aedes albopictus]|uniref:Chitin-binding type-2 domain-containing protein n=1 Tax=Aedes albopictus TaxID=7160 RepID=A0ABM2A6X1_AEDAL|nr:mucin-5AC-like [Aedes albopictus]
MATVTSRLRFGALLGTLLLVVTMVGAQESSSQQRPQVLSNDGSFKFAAKTSFSCSGRAAGYYADVETGCQIYHMCDGLGRQFSYACPNTTLFQQRMLICDHWYMVNCSKAESNYAANLLIGQRDKPFVTDDENELRTPRPDLLDTPYAAGFNMDAFKYNYFKTNTQAPQNAIPANGKNSGKNPTVKPKQTTSEIFEESASNHGLPIHWSTRYAKEDDDKERKDEKQELDAPLSTAIPLSTEEVHLQGNKVNGRRDVKEGESKTQATVTEKLPSRVEEAASNNNQVNVKVPSIRYEPPFTPEEQVKRGGNGKESLGAGFKPFESILNFNKKGNRKDYDFSNFFGRNESIRNTAPTQAPTPAATTTPRTVPSSTTRFFSSSSTTPSRPTARFTTTPRQTAFVTSPSTTSKPITIVVTDLQPPQLNPAQFSTRTGPAFRPSVPTTAPRGTFSTVTTTTTTPRPVLPLSDPRQSNRAPTTIHFNPPAATAGLFENRFALQRPPVTSKVPVPARDLLPPYQNVANFDKIKNRFVSEAIFTRQPITNEPSSGPIKSGIDKLQGDAQIQVRNDNVPRPFSVPTPANDLLPPKKEYVFYDDATTKGPPIYYQWKWSIPSFGLEPPLDAPLSDEEKLLTQLNPAAQDLPDSNREHNQTARSISSETGNAGENPPTSNAIAEANKRKIQPPTHNYLELRKQLAIPDFTFPLESAGTAQSIYEQDGAVNSFQIKIPAYARSDDDSRAWYGENAKCPQCHPAFMRPGTCEPCIKIRR